MLLAPLAATLLAEPAAAQQRAAAARPQITNMALNSDAGLSPGATLRVQLYATPKAGRASLALGDSGITVPLRERSAGNYTGSYVVRRGDRIDPTQLMTARVTFGSRAYSRQFNYPTAFQALAMGAAPAASQPAIERFVMRPGGRLEPGRELRFRLVGAPGGDAWLDIPGVISGVDLAEVRPGVYEGTYTVRRRDDLNAFDDAVATLRTGDRRARAKVDVRGGDREFGSTRDERAPQITELTPDNAERVTERNNLRIAARISDDGSGIAPGSVRLRLNGRDVTPDTRVTDDRVVYRDDLAPGRYTAELTVRDRAGNASTKSWGFDVVDRDRERVGSGPLPLEITSHSNNTVVDGNGNLAIRGRTVPHATVRVQVESVANVGGVLGLSQPVADHTVQADRDGRFSVAVSPRGAFIPGTRYDVRVTSTAGTQTAEERLTLIQRQG